MNNGQAATTKARVAFFDFTGCEGCQLTVLDALQTYPELLEVVEIVEFREAMSERSDEYQIAFVEGSCSRASDEPRLRQIRQRAELVIALGACAHLGGVNALRNLQDPEEVRHYVYDHRAHWYETYRPRPISAVIRVDGTIPGCPINREEFVGAVKALLQGRLPEPPDYPICIECKLRENVCLFLRDQACLGPITRAGCNAVCPSYGKGCEGCRGLVSNANLALFRQVLAAQGLSAAAIEAKLTLFLTNEMMKVEQPAVEDQTHA